MEDEEPSTSSKQLKQAVEMEDETITEINDQHHVAVEAGPSEAQRAYIAHAAPHLGCDAVRTAGFRSRMLDDLILITFPLLYHGSASGLSFMLCFSGSS